MKKIFLFYCFTAIFHSILLAQPSYMGEIIIQGNRISRPFSKPVQNISVITREQIAKSPARSIQEILTYVAGVDVRQRGVGGVQADIGIRGGGFEQTLILLNGVKLSDPQTGHHMMNIPVPLEAIERIEIIKGSATRSFGLNGIAGAINIITRLGSEQQASVSAYGADFSTFGGQFFLTQPVSSMYYQNISGSFDVSEGYQYNSDYQVSNINYESALRISNSLNLRGMIGFTGRDFGANGFYSNKFPDQWEQTKTLLSSLALTYSKNNLYFQTRAYFRQNDDEFRLKRFDPSFYTNIHQSRTLGFEFNGTFRSKLGITGLGAEMRQERLESTNLGQRERTFYGIFAEHAVTIIKGLDAQLGVHASYYSTYEWKMYPGIDLGYQISPSNRIYGNYSLGYRVPSYTEWYYQDPATSSNSNLIPEQASNAEFGYIFNKYGLRFEACYFNRYSQNLIDYIRDTSSIVPNPNKWTPENVGNVKFNGLELSLGYGIYKSLFNFMEIQNVGLSYNFIDANFEKDLQNDSRYILNAYRHQFIAGLTLDFFNMVQVTLKSRYIERYTDVKYWLMDGKMIYHGIPKLNIFAEWTNITDQEYVESGFVQMPGRWIKVGCTIKLN